MRHRLDGVLHNKVGSPHITPLASIITIRMTPSLGAYGTCVDILKSGGTRRSAVGNLRDTRKCVHERLTHAIGVHGAPRVAFVMSRSVRCKMGVDGGVSRIAESLGSKTRR